MPKLRERSSKNYYEPDSDEVEEPISKSRKSRRSHPYKKLKSKYVPSESSSDCSTSEILSTTTEGSSTTDGSTTDSSDESEYTLDQDAVKNVIKAILKSKSLYETKVQFTLLVLMYMEPELVETYMYFLNLVGSKHVSPLDYFENYKKLVEAIEKLQSDMILTVGELKEAYKAKRSSEQDDESEKFDHKVDNLLDLGYSVEEAEELAESLEDGAVSLEDPKVKKFIDMLREKIPSDAMLFLDKLVQLMDK